MINEDHCLWFTLVLFGSGTSLKCVSEYRIMIKNLEKRKNIRDSFQKSILINFRYSKYPGDKKNTNPDSWNTRRIDKRDNLKVMKIGKKG